MPRGPRNIQDNTYHHVIVRGNDGKTLFSDPYDYGYFKQTLLQYYPSHFLYILHYCFMPNHIHFLMHVETAAHLPIFMKSVLQVYAQYHHRRHSTKGFLFNNRYKNRYINSEGYLLECGRYIERNPLKAGLVKNILDYPWSSYKVYAKEKPDKLVTRLNPMYENICPDKKERRKTYREYVLTQRPYESL